VSINAKGIPTAECINCGERWFLVPVVFDTETYMPAMWGTNASCYNCKSPVTAPTPLDHPEYANGEPTIFD
jgi:hypothetical protein